MNSFALRLLTFCVAFAALGLSASAAVTARAATLPPSATHKVDFSKEIQPLLAKHCFECHGPKKQKNDLRLDVKESALKGGESGPSILPGKSAESRLIHLVAGLDKESVMPPKGERLTPEQIGLLRGWIDQGAIWPEPTGINNNNPLEWWSLKPLVRPLVPDVRGTGFSIQNPVDAFIVTKLRERKLAQSPEADRRTLIRRLYFDLIGLPPSPEEVAAFMANKDPQAYAKLVDKLLASPRHGERWARHWLDVVRFAESDGFETNQPRPNAWHYRDYVIRAFNEDKPYDRFVLEQLAGDQFGADAATGFLVAGPWDRVKSPDPVLTANQRADELHDMVSTTGSAFLGLTIGCARCHNHKFDPIPQTDYFAVKAIFAGVQHGERATKPANFAEIQTKADALRRELIPFERKLAQFDPPAQTAQTIILHTDDTNRAVQLLPSKGAAAKYPDGFARGQAGDTGDATRLPTLGKGYLYWNQVPGKDVFAWTPRVDGRFRLWLSWGGGHKAHAEDARYFLDRDGDLATTGDQTEIARANHRKFADKTGDVPETRQWSGFLDAGVQGLNRASKIILRGAANGDHVSADVAVFQEEAPQTAGRAPRIRLPVTRGKNTERFAPIVARFVRFTIAATTQLEPCIDELEVFTTDETPRNVALATAGAKATSSGNYPDNSLHKLENINDGLYGNERSWISNERGKGQVQIAFAKAETIDRVLWSRDRDNVPRYNDRLATRYQIEISLDGATWRTVATADDRLAFGTKIPGGVIYATDGMAPAESGQLASLLAARKKLETNIAAARSFPMIYAGRFVTPADTFRLHRGDPMQPREVIAPGGLTKLGANFVQPTAATDADRRLALAKWIASAENPLTARVMVNRLWHYHFGRGIVDTPSDFGLNGGRPSHPELLDWLASELIAQKWSLKSLHRIIVASAAYRQANAHDAKATESDVDNRLLWQFPARRLEAEAIRDAILAVAGKLDLTSGGPGFDLFEPNGNYVKVYNSRREFDAASFRRMVYQQKPRMQLDDIFGAFDCPDAGQIAPRRTRSTTPLQALNLLNSPFLLQQAEFFAERVKTESKNDATDQVRRAFQVAFSREPSAEETAAGVALVRDHGLVALGRALFNANEFLFTR